MTLDAKGKLDYVQAQSATSTDRKTWTVKIKPGWTFHNGEPVTAQSYVDGLNAAAYGPSGWGGNFEMSNIEGYSALNPTKGDPTTKALSGLKVVDQTTFTVTLTHPDSQLPYELAGQAWSPLPQVALADPKGYDEAPIGDGPFEMVGTWQHNVQIVMKPYVDYKGIAPKVSKLTFKIYSSPDAAYTDAQAGNVDLSSLIPAGKLTQVKSDFDNRVFSTEPTGVTYLAFPLWDSRFKDVRVRQAISMAIDRQSINEKLFGGTNVPATGLLSPGLVGGATTSCGQYCSYNPTKAKALLAAAGGLSGSIVLYDHSDNGTGTVDTAISNELRQNLGIDVKITQFPNFTQFYAAEQKQNFTGPYISGWGPEVPSPKSILQGLFASTASFNGLVSGYHTPALDQLIASGDTASTPDGATSYYHQADAAIMADMPVTPLYWAGNIYVYTSRVAGVTAGLNGFVDLSAVSVK